MTCTKIHYERVFFDVASARSEVEVGEEFLSFRWGPANGCMGRVKRDFLLAPLSRCPFTRLFERNGSSFLKMLKRVFLVFKFPSGVVNGRAIALFGIEPQERASKLVV
jgi:hypothetical protein